ncbi:MAG: diguanylate cyclase (GGDEF)-like protein [Porticoccaceae bacterium]|jgi:diguanylate cyclase (GGDEF)-like protein|tara:strand:+ start:240 stop:1247 length:1008 start_codon:yes stop_codon:yes gene_type:complete
MLARNDKGDRHIQGTKGLDSYDFVKSVLDASTDSIVVLEAGGEVVFANHHWKSFGRNNGFLSSYDWDGTNYLEICDVAAAKGDGDARHAAEGIRRVSRAEQDTYTLEYPCHSSTERRWFIMKVGQFVLSDMQYLVVSHQDITQRKLAEEKVAKLARLDDLTGIPNRRKFDESLSLQWKRSIRMNTPISLAMIDIDHFKQVNDTYGHSIGDKYLTVLSSIFSRSTNRPDDICARYGGEEFAVLLGATDRAGAVQVIDQLIKSVRHLKIPNENASTKPIITLSVGLKTVYPNKNDSYEDFLLAVDKLLYTAKTAGRDTMAVSVSSEKLDTTEFELIN